MMRNNTILAADRKAPYRGGSSGGLLICVCFALGCVLGAFFAGDVYSGEQSKFLFSDLPQNDAGAFWEVLRFISFHAAALFLGTSLTGVFFVPLLAVARGFAFSCSSAVIIGSGGGSGVIAGLVSLGLPALFSVPCFIVVCEYAVGRSKRLIALSNGRSPGYFESRGGALILTIPVLIIGALIDIYLVPALILMIN